MVRKSQEIAEPVTTNQAKQLNYPKRKRIPNLQYPISQTPKFIIPNPGIAWSQIGGLDSITEKLLQFGIYSFTQLKIFTSENQLELLPNSLILYGPSGTGKTLLAQALATETFKPNTPKITFFSASATDLISPNLNNCEKPIRKLFTLAAKQSPSILFFDEISWLFTKSTNEDSEILTQIRQEFIRQIDQSKKQNIFIFATTNEPQNCCNEMWPIFEEKVELFLPNERQRMDIMTRILENIPN